MKVMKEKKLLIWIFCIFILSSLITLIYHLHFTSAIFLTIFASFLIPGLRKSVEIEKNEKKRFEELCLYMEQLICSYKRKGKILAAIEDCICIFESDTSMMKALLQVKISLVTGEGLCGIDLCRESLEKMEVQYKSKRLVMLHSVLSCLESCGGQHEKTMDILLEDLQLWKTRTALFQKQKQHIRIESILATILAAILCYVSRMLTPAELNIDLTTTLFYQITTTFIFAVFYFIFYKIQRKLTGGWLDSEILSDQEEHKFLRLYQILGSKKSSFSLYFTKKALGKETESRFPYWLLFVALLLQTESVYIAIKKSVEYETGYMKEEILLLLNRLYENPSDLETYLSFFQKLNMGEILSSMKILYSISSGGYEANGNQLGYLISRNNQLMDRGEKNRYEKHIAGLSLIKQVPMLAASLKLLADLVGLMGLIMRSFGSFV